LENDCTGSYLFRQLSPQSAYPLTDLIMTPEIGIIEERSGANANAAMGNSISLKKINDRSTERYLQEVCGTEPGSQGALIGNRLGGNGGNGNGGVPTSFNATNRNTNPPGNLPSGAIVPTGNVVNTPATNRIPAGNNNTANALGLVTEQTIQIRITELEAQIAEINEDLNHVPKDGLKESEMLAAIHHKETQLSKIHAFRRNNQLAKNAAKDDKLVKVEFHIPVGKQVNFTMRSQDVIHSAFMPHFRAQMNCVPGMVTRMRFVPTITTAEMRKKTGNPAFDYLLLCNKVCGAAHYNMQMNVIVDTQADYDKWIAEQVTFNEKLMATLGITEFDNQLAQNKQ
jgi:hypothetical protein